MYTAVIVDDMQIHSAYLQKALSNYNEIKRIESAMTSESAEALIMKLRPDLLFLDILLDHQNGFDMYNKIYADIDWDMSVIVYSSHEKYAIEGFKYKIFDFLKKTFDVKELEEILVRYFDTKALQISKHTKELQLQLKSRATCLIDTILGSEIIDIDKMLYFEYDCETNSELWFMILTNNKRILLKGKTTAQIILNYSINFVQINRHQIINILFLKKIKDHRCHFNPTFQRYCNDMLISRKYNKPLRQKFLKI
jgi:two-component system LytT family response regulator